MAEMLCEVLMQHREENADNVSPLIEKFCKHLVKSPPSFWWMQSVLSTCCPTHPVFAADYMPPPKERKSILRQPTIKNVSNFFSEERMNPQLMQRLLKKQK